MIRILPLPGIGEIAPGDDLAAILREALARGADPAAPGDVLIVTQKIVSKSEGRYVDLASVVPGPQALALAETTRKDARMVELVLAESDEIVRAAPDVLIARHRLGHVMANAGIDRSNLGPGDPERALLLPLDSDRSAAALSRALGLPVVISDSFGRPWRAGVVSVALGVAGMPALDDRRGQRDRDGRVLEVTQVALGDAIATAASLVMGEGGEGIPAALLRGWAPPAGTGRAADLVRPAAEDLFR